MAFNRLDWTRRARVTINSTSAPLTGFCAVITEANLPAEIFTTAKADGSDIRLCLDKFGADELPIEVVSFDTVGNKAVIWTRLPNANTGTSFWVFYGNAAANAYAVTDPFGRNAVWVDWLVYTHDGVTDSTGNSTPTSNNVGSTAWSLGNAATFNGTNSRVDLLPAVQNSAAPYTATAYVKLNSTPAEMPIYSWADKDVTNRQHRVQSLSSDLRFSTFDGTVDNFQILNVLNAVDRFKIVATITSSAERALFFNGGNKLTNLSSFNVPQIDRLTLGTTADSTPFGWFNGEIAEAGLRASVMSDDYISTEYANQSSPATFFTTDTPEGTGINGIEPTQWQRRVQITAQGAQPTLSGFVAVITQANLPAEIWSIALNGGGDLRLCLNSDGTGQLPLEVVSFDTAAQTAVLWTRFPSFATGTSCWLFYGKAGETQPPVTDTYGRNAVWVGAYQKFHLDESTGTVTTSSTGLNNGTYTSPLPRIGANGGQDFAFNDEGVVNIGGATNISNTAFTLSATIRPDNFNNPANIIGSDDSGTGRNWQWRITADGQLVIIVWDATGSIFIGGDTGGLGTTVLSTTQKSKVDFVFDGSSYVVYLNGSPEITVASATLSRRVAADVYIGARRLGSGFDKFEGEIFDAEIWSGSAKSPDYISTEYANQSSPSTFFLPGTPENTTGGNTGVNVSISGVQTTSAIGTPNVTGAATFTVNGVQTNVELGTVTISTEAGVNVTITGVQSNVQLGDVTVSGAAATLISGVETDVQLGSVTVTTASGATVNITGVQTTVQLGTVTVDTSSGATVSIQGVSTTAQVGSPTVTGAASVTITGVESVLTLGSVSAGEVTQFTINGVQTNIELGSVTVRVDEVILVDGVETQVILSGVSVWGSVIDTQNPSWSAVSDANTPNWTNVKT